eukprot:scaffold3070_cov133-Isochrysis_galbana.AAC.1
MPVSVGSFIAQRSPERASLACPFRRRFRLRERVRLASVMPGRVLARRGCCYMRTPPEACRESGTMT